MATIISGKELSVTIRNEIAEEAKLFTEAHGRAPGLVVIIVGEDPASQVYVRNKHRACGECGFWPEVVRLPEETKEEELLSIIDEYNAKESVDGILVQLPLPKHINATAVINRISPDKDVDVFHPVNVGRLTTGDHVLSPCTPAGVMEMIKRSGIEVKGKKFVIISAGPDGEFGTEDDIRSDKIEKTKK